MTRLSLDPSSLHPARLTPPLSKSDAQRALVLAHLLRRPQLFALGDGPGDAMPADTLAAARGLEALRAAVGGHETDIDCGAGGAPFRLLVSQAALTPGARIRFFGTERLAARPHRPLLESLERTLGPAGLRIHVGAPWPVEVDGATGRAANPLFEIDGSESSQFASSLLLAAAALHLREGRTWTVRLRGSVASAGYLEMTEQWLDGCGFSLEKDGTSTRIVDWREPATWPAVPGDWSSLGYLLLVAWRCSGVVERVDLSASHPDRAIARMLASVGLSLEPENGGVISVQGRARGGLLASADLCPDLIPTLVALACVLPDESRFEKVSILRHKESDRLQGVQALARAAGAETTLERDALIVRPPQRDSGGPSVLALDSADDHRMAMSAAVLAILTDARLELTNPRCVEKSFPDFWEQLARTGARLVFTDR